MCVCVCVCEQKIQYVIVHVCHVTNMLTFML